MNKTKWIRVLKIIAVNVLILVVLLFILEVVLKKISPVNETVTGSELIICDSVFYDVPHPLLGFYNLPGKYNCDLGPINFNLNILEDSSRYTGFNGFDENCTKTQKVYLFGCSITWGHGLTDEATMAYKLQSKLKCTEVKNYGIGAGSNVQSYILLKSLIERGEAPDIVVVNYGSLHDERNAFKGKWRQMWQHMLVDNKINETEKDFGKLLFPYAEIDEKDSVQFKKFPVYEILDKVSIKDKSEVMEILVRANAREDVYALDGEDISVSKKQVLSYRVLKEIHKLCKANKIEFIVTGIYNDDSTIEVLQLLNADGINTVDISVDNFDNNYTLAPVDGHPNDTANTIYTERLYEFLTSNDIVEE